MSRYSLTPKQPGVKVDVGWDIYAGSFYLQVRTPRSDGKSQIKAWSGTGVGGPELKGVVFSPEEIIEEASVYAEIPLDLSEKLRSDRETDGDIVSTEPVIYAGMTVLEVWRCRKGVDPESGVRLRIRPSKNFSPEIRVAYAMLCDFLGDPIRAKLLSKQFARCMFKEVFAGKRWMMTEVDMQTAVFGVEQMLDLHWINEAKCYAGQAESVPPEKQLDRLDRRARRKKLKTGSPIATEESAAR